MRFINNNKNNHQSLFVSVHLQQENMENLHKMSMEFHHTGIDSIQRNNPISCSGHGAQSGGEGQKFDKRSTKTARTDEWRQIKRSRWNLASEVLNIHYRIHIQNGTTTV